MSKRKNLKDAIFVIDCPHCGAKQTTELAKQPEVCTQCDQWFRVGTQIKHQVKLIITKHHMPDSKVEIADNPPHGGKKEENEQS